MSNHTPKQNDTLTPLNIAVLTISDTRNATNDASGRYLADQIRAAGHRVAERAIEIDDIHHVRARVSAWLVDPRVQVIITTGGTGLRERDRTPEAIGPLLERKIEGFGELFRAISAEEIGTSTLQSRCLAGLANHRLVCCLPGSPAACRTAWERILCYQLDSRHQPCNFVQLLSVLHSWSDLAAATRNPEFVSP